MPGMLSVAGFLASDVGKEALACSVAPRSGHWKPSMTEAQVEFARNLLADPKAALSAAERRLLRKKVRQASYEFSLADLIASGGIANAC